METIDHIIVNISDSLSSMNYESKDKIKEEKYVIFPKLRNGGNRVSEQEARILFTQELDKLKVFYSVETPTTNTFNFTGSNKLSGNLDLCIYKIENNKFKKELLIEFKAHTKSCKNDFEKLLHEPENGTLIHILKAIDNRTLNRVLKYYESDIKDLYTIQRANLTKFLIEDWFINIYVCSMSPQFVIKKSFTFNDLKNIDSFFKIDYQGKAHKLEFKNLNGWIELK